MMKFREEKGFSLVELMIVVAIMAILAAIAIPSFMRFQLKAKTGEATNNLAAIRTCEVTYETENDVYLACAAAPRAAAAVNDTKTAWTDPADFESIGFAPEGAVRYSYAVTLIAADATTTPPVLAGFSATATGDLDEDSTAQTFTIATTDANYPNVSRSADI